MFKYIKRHDKNVDEIETFAGAAASDPIFQHDDSTAALYAAASVPICGEF